MLIFFSVMTLTTQILLKTDLSKGSGHNEIGISATDGVKLYQEGTAIFLMRDDSDEDISLYRNGEYVGNFATGKVGIRVYEGDVLEFICRTLKGKKTILVDSVSDNILSLKKGQTFFIYDKKITQVGIMRLKKTTL